MKANKEQILVALQDVPSNQDVVFFFFEKSELDDYLQEANLTIATNEEWQRVANLISKDKDLNSTLDDVFSFACEIIESEREAK